MFASDLKATIVVNNTDSLLPENMTFTKENLAILDTFDEVAMQMRDSARRGAN